MKGLKIVWALIAAVVLVKGMDTIGNHWSFGFNETESLPFWAFVVDKDDKTPVRGEYFQFLVPPNPYYPTNSPFVKHVLGVPGDVVTVKGREFFINGQSVGVAKTHSKTGLVAEMASPGVIPAGHYFMSAPNKDSLDSRYAVIGLIDAKRIVGKAKPVM
jgi:conjugal transfer pilin signal peptidase TrbI